MTEWNDAVKSRLMAYCRIDALEDGEDLLLQGLYDAAVSYHGASGDLGAQGGDTPESPVRPVYLRPGAGRLRPAGGSDGWQRQRQSYAPPDARAAQADEPVSESDT